MAGPSSSATPPQAGHRPPVSVILHGHRWPSASVIVALRARLHEALPDAEIIEAREHADAAIGAAALMAAAVTRATGSILLFLEPSLLPAAADLRTLIDTASASQCLALTCRRGWDSNPRGDDSTSRFQGGPVTTTSVPSEGLEGTGATDLLSRLAAELANAEAFAPAEQHQPTFAISRDAYDTLGGLDARLWSVGIADDLIARAGMAGVTVRHLDITPEIAAPPAYPLRPEIARLLSIRNAFLIAFKTESANDLGETTARLAMQALLESWRATGLSTDAFAFGGGWGRNAGTIGALRHRLTGRGGLEAPLADPGGCLLPLLAIDSALDELSTAPSSSASTAIDERNAWQRMARGSHHADHTAITRDYAAADESRAPAALVSEPPPLQPPPLPDTPTVSVVVVNWNGKTHLRDCFGSLQRSDYPADEARTDLRRQRIERMAPSIFSARNFRA